MERSIKIKASIRNIKKLFGGCLFVISGIGLIIASIIMLEASNIVAKHMTEINNIGIKELRYLIILQYPPVGIALIIIGIAEILEIRVSTAAYIISAIMSSVSLVTGLYIINLGGSYEVIVLPGIVLIVIISMWLKQNKTKIFAT